MPWVVKCCHLCIVSLSLKIIHGLLSHIHHQLASPLKPGGQNSYLKLKQNMILSVLCCLTMCLLSGSYPVVWCRPRQNINTGFPSLCQCLIYALNVTPNWQTHPYPIIYNETITTTKMRDSFCTTFQRWPIKCLRHCPDVVPYNIYIYREEERLHWPKF